MRDFHDLNDTSKYLAHIIFKPGSLKYLLQFGLQNTYIDDFKHRCKYENCLLFLIDPLYPVNSKTYQEFEQKIVSFKSFYDYYEIDKKIMYVFRVPDTLVLDYHTFKLRNYDSLTDVFWESMGARQPLNLNHVKFNIEDEIYRFDTNLTLNKEKIKKGNY
jgi:hypothetical protein